MQTLTFQNTTLTPVVQKDGQIWLSSSDLAKALDYSQSNAVTKLYNENADEFTSCMTMVIETMTNGINNSQRKIKTRIFSLRGCHLIAMFARTAIAKEFRQWVLDILDKEVTGISESPKTTTDDRTPLRQAVSLMVSRCGLDYSTAYTLVHQYMGVNHIDEIALVDLPKAIDYVHSLIIKPVVTQDEFSIACHQTVNKVMDYLHGLHREIARLGGTSPKLDVDEDMIARAILTRMVQGKRFMISLDYWSKPTLTMIDQQSWIVRSDNIAKIIADPALQRSGLAV